MSILELSSVSYQYQSRYQTVEAVRDVSCAFETGQMTAIMGRSGCGKTTLLSLIAALDLPTGGEIRFSGTPTSRLDRDRYRRRDVAVIYQSFRLFPLLTAQENVMYPMALNGIRPKEARERADALLAKVQLPAGIGKQFPRMMSGGEQQRVAVARALASDAKVLLADEPTGNLDSENGWNIIGILKSLAHEEGYCVIVVTHDADIGGAADRCLHMVDGRLETELTG